MNRFRKTIMAPALATALALTGGIFAHATGAPGPMSDPELASVRGGYLSANGITFGFGATVSTYVDGALALETRLTVTDSGLLQSQVAGAASGAVPLNAAAAQAAGLAGLIGQGVILGGEGGTTTIVHNLSGNQVLNFVVNGASDRTITQNTAVTSTLPAFSDLQRNAAAQQVNASLLSAVGVGALGAVRH